MPEKDVVDKIIEDIEDSFAEIYDQLSSKLDEIIETEGEFEGVPGDIVDTGQLKDSKEGLQEKRQISFEYDPVNPDDGYHYAEAVYSGFFAHGGTKYIPARRWTDRAVKKLDPTQVLADSLSEKGYDVTIESNGNDQIID